MSNVNLPEYTLLSKCELPAEVEEIMIDDEKFVTAYKTYRDSVTFTNKRIVFRDSQGLSGKKVEVYSIPYSTINAWSSENARGIFDVNAEVELWTRAGHLKLKLGKGIDIREIDRLLANAIL